MTYPVVMSDVGDPYIRGEINMFARLVEIQNSHPEWIDDAVINELYKEVEKFCDMTTKRVVYTMPSGKDVTE